MNYPALSLFLALFAGSASSAVFAAEPATRSSAAADAPATVLLSLPDAETALAWLQENYPPGSDLRFDLDFLAAASDAFDDPENASVRLYVYYSGAHTHEGRPVWTAWIGVDDELIAVLLGSSAAAR
jgi:hypothetical protein